MTESCADVDAEPRGECGAAQDPEAEWQDLAAVADGDEMAFERLVRQYEGRLFRLCWRMLGDPGEAEEVVQEVFLKLYRKAASFVPKGQLYTLLYRVATNMSLNRLRRRKIVRFLSLASDEEERREMDPIDPSPDALEGVEAAQRWRQVAGTLEQLPAGQRAVIVLVKIEGLSYKEAAKVLGITLGAVESRLFRAMRRLEQELAT